MISRAELGAEDETHLEQFLLCGSLVLHERLDLATSIDQSGNKTR